MRCKIFVKGQVEGTSKKGNAYRIANVIVSECKEAPFLTGAYFGIFLDDYLSERLTAGTTCFCDLDLIPNKKDYANLHYSANYSNFEFLDK